MITSYFRYEFISLYVNFCNNRTDKKISLFIVKNHSYGKKEIVVFNFKWILDNISTIKS